MPSFLKLEDDVSWILELLQRKREGQRRERGEGKDRGKRKQPGRDRRRNVAECVHRTLQTTTLL